MLIPKPSREDLAIFRDLFLGPWNAVVIDGKKVPECRRYDYSNDDLLLRHFSGEVSAVAALVTPGPGGSSANQFAVSFHSTDSSIAKAIVAELAELGIVAYVECDLRSRYTVRGFIAGSVNSLHAFVGLPAWYGVERARLRLAATIPFNIHPKFPHREPKQSETFGEFLELPFAPRGGRFVDPDTLVPYPDQWAFLRSIVRNPQAALWNTFDFVMGAFRRRKNFDALGRPIAKGPRPKTRSPYEGMMFAELRAGHDAIYFAPWRRPEATPIDIIRAHHQIGPLLAATAQALKEKDFPVRRDIDQVIDTLSNNFPGEDSPELVVLMDKALSYTHRAIDALLQDKGLPPHNSLDFATAIRTA